MIRQVVMWKVRGGNAAERTTVRTRLEGARVSRHQVDYKVCAP